MIQLYEPNWYLNIAHEFRVMQIMTIGNTRAYITWRT